MMDNNKPQLIDLWHTSFNDSEEFVELFFDHVYKKENALCIEKIVILTLIYFCRKGERL